MTDLEQQLLSLQEEFQKLQEAAAQVEGCLERRIFELEAALRRSQHDYEVVVGEKNQLQVSEAYLIPRVYGIGYAGGTR